MAIPTDFTGDPPVTGDNGSGSDGVPTIPGQNLPEVIDQDYEDKVEKLRAAYWKYLDRPATDEDIDGWMSGRFHGGGIDDWVNAIQNSEEAQRHAGPGTGPGTGGGTGVPPRTGQAPPGYDQGKWDDPEHGTAKYDAAAFLQGLTKPSDIAAMVRSPAFQARFPGATFNDKDKIDFGSNLEGGNRIGVIDVLMRSDQGADTSGGLWWGAGGGAAPTPAPTGTAPTGGDPLDTGRGLTQGITDGVNPLSAPNLAAPPNTLMGPRGGGMMGPGGGGGTMGQMITPYNPLATYSPVPYTPAAPFAQNPFAAATPFTGPTATDMTADPGYQFRLQQGQEALERSGAARGVTNTGGTLKDILDYGQQAASQEYGNVFGRQRDVYDLNERNRFDAYQANYGNAMDAYNLNERNRYQGYTTNEIARLNQNQQAEARRSGAYGTNLGAYERQQQYGLKQQGQGFDQSFRNWQEQFNQQRLNQTTAFNQRFILGGAQ
jgi:hypothetical protein